MHDNLENIKGAKERVDHKSWSRLSEQNLRVDKWSVSAGVRLPDGAAAG